MFRAHQRLRSGFLTALACGLVSGVFVATVHAELQGRDITRQVTVEVSDLKDAGKVGRYVAEVRLHNDTNGTFAGPILISVESTGVEGLSLERADGQLVDGTEYIRIVSDVSQLRAESKSASKRVYFVTEEKLTADAVETFAPKIKVWQGEKVVVQTADTDLQPGRTTSGIGMRKPSGRGTSGTGESGLQPTPDPGFTPETETPSNETGEEGIADKEKHERRERILPTDEDVAKVVQAQNQFKQTARKMPGVVGTSTSLNSRGEVVIRVMVKDLQTADQLPKEFNGVPVEAKLMEGDIKPLLQLPGPNNPLEGPNKPLEGGNRGHFGRRDFNRDTGVNPTCPPQNPREFMPRPVPIGVSIGNAVGVIAEPQNYCSAGTLSCRVKDRFGNVYLLSNSHVIANNGEIRPGTVPDPSFGEPINQPASLDFGCFVGFFTEIGSLVDFTTVRPGFINEVDAAIAVTDPLLVGVSTPCDGYGVPRERPIQPRLGMRVMKYGRTTGFTASTITSINIEIVVGGATYIDLFAFDPSIGAAGDSGSLVVKWGTREPLGLFTFGLNQGVYALEGYAFPIQKALNRFDVRIDGDPSRPKK